MKDKLAFFTEVNRLLRPGGRFVVAAWLSREQPALWESKYLLEPICVEGRLPSMASAPVSSHDPHALGFAKYDLPRSDAARPENLDYLRGSVHRQNRH